jgi:hypothetical protein
MHLQTAGKVAAEAGKLTGWINWVGRHPGIVLLGALVMAILSVQTSPGARDSESDSDDEEVPLFI